MPEPISKSAPVYLLVNKQDWPEIAFAPADPKDREGWKAPLPPPFSAITDFIQQRFADYGPIPAAKSENGGIRNVRHAMHFGGLIVRMRDAKVEAVMGYNYYSRDNGDGATQRCCHIGFVLLDESLRKTGKTLPVFMKMLVAEATRLNVSHIALNVDLGNQVAADFYHALEKDGLLRRTRDGSVEVTVDGIKKELPERSFEGSVYRWMRALKIPVPAVEPVRARGVSPEKRRVLLALS